MEINIGDNNKINKSIISKNNMTALSDNGAVKEIIIGVAVTIIGAVVLWALGI